MTQYKDSNFFVEPRGNIYKLTKNGFKKIGWKNSRNYIHVSLPNKKSLKVHRIIAETFIPNPNKLPHVNHINGQTDDNRVENLEWVTPSQNQTHAYRTGLRKTKITFEDANNIRIRVANGEKKHKLADEYGIHRSHISLIIRNKLYVFA